MDKECDVDCIAWTSFYDPSQCKRLNSEVIIASKIGNINDKYTDINKIGRDLVAKIKR